MNMQECQELVDSYVAWLRQGFSVNSLDKACELTTPFLDRHNDHLQIYAYRDDGKIILTDDGYTLADLRTSGLDLNTPKRKEIIESFMKAYGAQIRGHEIVMEASEQNIGHKLHSLVQSMLAVNDMFVMAQPRVASFFWEDVQKFLEDHEVRFSPRVKITGRSGYDHAIDFLIPKSRTGPERFVQAINAPTKNTIGTYLFSLSDTREARGPESQAYAFLNDRERKVSGEVVNALEAYQVKAAPWRHREEYVQALAD